MKKFTVDPAVFAKLPDYCLGVVVVEGFDNAAPCPAIDAMLDQSAADFAARHAGDNVRELPGVKACREAFQALSMNPNKFMVSIEALAKRVQKNGALPHINPLVDLGNALSLRHEVPMGAHDIDKMEPCGIAVRFAGEGDSFLPMGEEAVEVMPEGELCYVSGHTVKTRRWMWRQSEDGKITAETSHVFFPIDGFSSVNLDSVLAAREELAAFLRDELGLTVKLGFIDRDHPEMEIGD
ncbi:MAG: phenylalanine--tRNA ligase beta subunit-related protein [Eubacteriales bacterium]|nr:phenylalanine--tRNA ligase beta subunit-related protein [Eubacteriales bacterium]